MAATVTPDDADTCRELADHAGVSLSEWLGALIRQEIERVKSLSDVAKRQTTSTLVSIPLLDKLIRLNRRTKLNDADEAAWEEMMEEVWREDTFPKICSLAKSALVARRQLDGE